MNSRFSENDDVSPVRLESLQNLIVSFARRIRGDNHSSEVSSEAGSDEGDRHLDSGSKNILGQFGSCQKLTNSTFDLGSGSSLVGRSNSVDEADAILLRRPITNQNDISSQDQRRRPVNYCRSVDLSRRSDTGIYVSFYEEDGKEDVICCSLKHGLDIVTGHVVLSFMEDHFRNPSKLSEEWVELTGYEAEGVVVSQAIEPENIRKNRTLNILPYDHNRFVLNSEYNVNHGDYINASVIIDHDPKKPSYIFSQGPLPHTVADFWQMVWESRSTAIINLTSIADHSECHPYWPESGTEVYHKYEVHLVSQHISSTDYVVRSLLLKNLNKNESRTVTQYHYLLWPVSSLPFSVESLLEFRRKVSRFSRGKTLVIHCSDGSGRTGTYALLDTVINRIMNSTKELNISATLEHFRDQRMKVVQTKEQYEFVLLAVVESIRSCLQTPCHLCNPRT